MKNDLTELVFVLDKSGSMHGLEKDTIGGFNGMLDKQRQEAGDALVSTVLFSNESSVIHDRVPLSEVAPLTEKEYRVGGCTALLDAIGGAVHHIANIHKYARPEDVPAHTVFVITTDGMENASRRWSAEAVRKLIKEKQSEYGWEFLFLGANIDAVETAHNFGIREDHAVRYCSDAAGTATNFRALNKAVAKLRTGAPLAREWKQEISEYCEAQEGRNG